MACAMHLHVTSLAFGSHACQAGEMDESSGISASISAHRRERVLLVYKSVLYRRQLLNAYHWMSRGSNDAH